jgi:hypothetical protein
MMLKQLVVHTVILHAAVNMESSINHVKPFPFFAQLQAKDQCELASALVEWTWGAPKPLLYALYILQRSCTLDSTFASLLVSSQGLDLVFAHLFALAKQNGILDNI